MDDQVPPPPYSERDVSSNGGISTQSTGNATPGIQPQYTPSATGTTTSTEPPYGRAKTFEPQYSPSNTSTNSSTSHPIHSPPYTPTDSQASTQISYSASASAVEYFESRPPLPLSDPNVIAHTITLPLPRPITGQTAVLRFPEPMRSRGVSIADWETFVNFLTPFSDIKEEGIHESERNRKTVEERLRRLRFLGDVTDGSIIEPRRPFTTLDEENEYIEHVVGEWNNGFFEPRGLHIFTRIIAPPRITDIGSRAGIPMTGSNQHDGAGQNEDGNDFRIGDVLSDHSEFHRGWESVPIEFMGRGGIPMTAFRRGGLGPRGGIGPSSNFPFTNGSTHFDEMNGTIRGPGGFPGHSPHMVERHQHAHNVGFGGGHHGFHGHNHSHGHDHHPHPLTHLRGGRERHRTLKTHPRDHSISTSHRSSSSDDHHHGSSHGSHGKGRGRHRGSNFHYSGRSTSTSSSSSSSSDDHHHGTSHRKGRGRKCNPTSRRSNRSSSTSSSSNGTDSLSEEPHEDVSLISLSNLQDDQLTTMKQSLYDWLDHPDHPRITSKTIKSINETVEHKVIENPSVPLPVPSKEDIRRLRHEIKGLLKKFEILQRVQKKGLKREKRALKKEHRREKREWKRERKQEKREKRREKREGKRPANADRYGSENSATARQILQSQQTGVVDVDFEEINAPPTSSGRPMEGFSNRGFSNHGFPSRRFSNRGLSNMGFGNRGFGGTREYVESKVDTDAGHLVDGEKRKEGKEQKVLLDEMSPKSPRGSRAGGSVVDGSVGGSVGEEGGRANLDRRA